MELIPTNELYACELQLFPNRWERTHFRWQDKSRTFRCLRDLSLTVFEFSDLLRFQFFRKKMATRLRKPQTTYMLEYHPRSQRSVASVVAAVSKYIRHARVAPSAVIPAVYYCSLKDHHVKRTNVPRKRQNTDGFWNSTLTVATRGSMRNMYKVSV